MCSTQSAPVGATNEKEEKNSDLYVLRMLPRLSFRENVNGIRKLYCDSELSSTMLHEECGRTSVLEKKNLHLNDI